MKLSFFMVSPSLFYELINAANESFSRGCLMASLLDSGLASVLIKWGRLRPENKLRLITVA